MSEITLSKKIKQLPPKARKQAIEFVDYLYMQSQAEFNKTSENVVREDSFYFGMWKDREDLKESSEWVQKNRTSEWEK
ncbi:hypothetical protein EP331_05385 [bacterium]|nr:MAG: hypothetical protein EP331_05385 [bacterium]